MNDNDLITAICNALEAGLTAQNITVPIQQSYQPTEQGAPVSPSLLLHKISDKRYGFPERSDAYDADTQLTTHTEVQRTEATFQIDAIAPQDPANPGLTASDYVNAAALIVGTDRTRDALRTSGIGMLRIMAIRQTFFTDEKGQYEASPSFDFTVTYVRTVSYTQPTTETLLQTVRGISTENVDIPLGIFDVSLFDDPTTGTFGL